MIRISTDRDIPKASLLDFYKSKKIEKYEDHYEDLYIAIKNSDYIVTAWDEDKLVGVIRSSGDYKFTQYVNNFLIHDDYNSKGIGSRMLDAYLEEASEVMDLYIISGRKITKAFTINWFKHKGFQQIMTRDDFHVFRKSFSTDE